MEPNTVTLLTGVGIFVALFGFWWKVDGKIEGVRQASDSAHKEILAKLGNIEKTQATHSERFNTVNTRIDCIEDKIDGIASTNN